MYGAAEAAPFQGRKTDFSAAYDMPEEAAEEHNIAKRAQAADENGDAQHAAVAGFFFQYRCGGWSIHKALYY